MHEPAHPFSPMAPDAPNPPLTAGYLTAAGADGDAVVPLHEASALTGGGRLAHIHLDGQFYALRITRQGKLILTK